MTERESRPGSGGAEENAPDGKDEAARGKNRAERDASKEAVEEEERTGGPGSTKEKESQND
jgi:hypothetical protein